MIYDACKMEGAYRSLHHPSIVSIVRDECYRQVVPSLFTSGSRRMPRGLTPWMKPTWSWYKPQWLCRC